MAWYNRLTQASTSKVLQSADSLVGTVFGDKDANQQASHLENLAVHQQHASEYQYRGIRFFFDAFVDGVNRLIRPVITIGAFNTLFVWPYYNPVSFAKYANSLSLVSEPLWWIIGVIMSFWFGSRSIFKDRHNFKTSPKTRLKEIQNYKVIDAIIDEELAALEALNTPSNKHPVFQSFTNK